MPSKWTTENKFNLWAHLDFITCGPKLPYTNEDDFAERKREILHGLRLALGGSFSESQIEQQLFARFCEVNKEAEYNFRLVFQHGSIELDLDESDKLIVSERLKGLQVSAPRTPRKTRSMAPPTAGSRNTSKLNRKRPVSPGSTLMSRSKKRRRGNRDSTPTNKSMRSRKEPSSNDHLPTSCRLRTPLTPKSDDEETARGFRIRACTSAHPGRARQSLSSSPNASRPIPNETKVITKKQEVVSSAMYQKAITEGASYKEKWKQALNDIEVLESLRQKYEDGIAAANGYHEKEAEAVQLLEAIHVLHEKYDDAVAESCYYRKKWDRTAEECNRLERDNRSKTALLQDKKGITKESQKRISSSEYEITKLKQLIDERDRLRPQFHEDKSHVEIGFSAEDKERIKALHYDLCDHFDHLVTIAEIQVPMGFLTRENTDLDKLHQGYCSLSLSDAQDGSTSLFNEKSTEGGLLRPLVAVALVKWVFDRSLDELHCSAFIETPLLKRYRDQISAVYGRGDLRMFDLKAHQAVVRTRDFRRTFVTRAAAQLSHKFNTAIRDLVRDYHAETTLESLGSILKAVFQAALELKCAVITSGYTFDCIWPLAGANVDTRYMDPEYGYAEAKETETAKEKVKTILVPGISRHKVPTSSNVVDYTGFHIDASFQPEEVDLIAKAKVLV